MSRDAAARNPTTAAAAAADCRPGRLRVLSPAAAIEKRMHLQRPSHMRFPSPFLSLVRPAAWACVLAIGVLSLLPHDEIEPVRNGYYGLGLTEEHAAAYTITMATVGLAYGGRFGLPRLAAALVTYGALLEFAQLLVPGRTAQVADALENAVGVIAGSMLLLIFRALRARWQSRQPRSA